MYCSNCGTQLVNGVSFCSNCGAKTSQQSPTGQSPMGQIPSEQIPPKQSPMGQSPMFQSPPKKKRKGLGCLIAILILFALIGLIIAIAVTSSQLSPTQGKATEQPKTAEELKAEGLAFDEKSWNDFLKIYDAHNDFMGTMDLYAQGKVSKLDFYDYCKDAEEWFGNTSLKFNYAKTEDEEEYLSTFSIFALSDQIAAKNVIKYLDSNSTKDLSKAREEIERATQAATIIAKNRAVFLKSIGLTTEEANDILNKAIAEMEKNESN